MALILNTELLNRPRFVQCGLSVMNETDQLYKESERGNFIINIENTKAPVQGKLNSMTNVHPRKLAVILFSYPGIDFQFTHAKVSGAIGWFLDYDISSRWSDRAAVQTHSSIRRFSRILSAEWIGSSRRRTVRGRAVGDSTDEIIEKGDCKGIHILLYI